MNALAHAQRAYGSASAPVRTPRATEYQAVARVTRQLRDAALKGSDGFPELAEALDRNRKLWTLFGQDVAHPDNGLPADLRQNLAGLAEFTRRHTKLVLGRKASVAPLIEINIAILRGLSGRGR